MVRQKVFNKAENIPGDWVPFGLDATAEDDIQLKVRLIPQEVQERINKRYGRDIWITDADGNKRPFRERDEEQSKLWLYDLAAFALLDIKNFEIEIGDEEGIPQWSRWLGGEEVKLGQAIDLEGKLGGEHGESIKRWLFKNSNLSATKKIEREDKQTQAKVTVEERYPISLWVWLVALDKAVEANQARRALEGNS